MRMKRGFTLPSIEELEVVLVDEGTLEEVRHYISACEHCVDHAAIPLDYLLDAVTGNNPTVTHYVMCRIPQCPACCSYLTEKTLVTTY
jgi:hypothetical protein